MALDDVVEGTGLFEFRHVQARCIGRLQQGTKFGLVIGIEGAPDEAGHCGLRSGRRTPFDGFAQWSMAVALEQKGAP